MKTYFLMTLCSIFPFLILPASAQADQMLISGSVQFWQRTCTPDYHCSVPAAVSERIVISDEISSPAPGTSLSAKTITFTSDGFTGQLSVYWKQHAGERFLAGQSIVLKDGVRIAECSQYSSDQIAKFIPVGFCAGYQNTDGSVTQYGMTYYK